MKVREIMTPDPVCCTPQDSAQKVARMLCSQDVGSVPVVDTQESRKLVGMITDRDLCCAIVAGALDAKTTPITEHISSDVVSCRDGENLDNCERLMRDHQIRRIPIVDGENKVIGIVSQADLALKDKPEKVSRTVADISKPVSGERIAA